MTATQDLVRLNQHIAGRETAGDRAFFETLLAPRFAMRRGGSLAYVGRVAFLNGVRPSGKRRTHDIEILSGTSLSAVVSCVVSLRQEDGRWLSYLNVRTFTRPAADQPWQLLAWANEPAISETLTPPGASARAGT